MKETGEPVYRLFDRFGPEFYVINLLKLMEEVIAILGVLGSDDEAPKQDRKGSK